MSKSYMVEATRAALCELLSSGNLSRFKSSKILPFHPEIRIARTGELVELHKNQFVVFPGMTTCVGLIAKNSKQAFAHHMHYDPSQLYLLRQTLGLLRDKDAGNVQINCYRSMVSSYPCDETAALVVRKDLMQSISSEVNNVCGRKAVFQDVDGTSLGDNLVINTSRRLPPFHISNWDLRRIVGVRGDINELLDKFAKGSESTHTR